MTNLTDELLLRGHPAPSRALFGAHCTNFATDNLPNARHAAYYARRAAGGAGIVVAEAVGVHPSNWPYEKALIGYDPAIVPRYRMLADAVHRHGALLLAQLNHDGMQASGHVRKHVVFAPSAIANPATMEMPKVMEPADVDALVAGFGRAAALATQGGLDGVEINAGQYSLVRQFLSGLTNQRQDEYGGALENRLRFARRVIAAVREAAGPDAVVGLRLSCDEYAPWAGITPEDGVEIARLLCASGEVDYLAVTSGGIYSLHMTSPAMHTPAGHSLGLAAAARAVCGVPVFGDDTLVDPAAARAAVRDGSVDGLDLTRALIADPDFVLKLREGRAAEIRPCIRCNQDCVVRSPVNQVVSCIHNPAAGYEAQLPPIERAARSRRVLVVGAGPGGLEVARVAALRGHEVTVYERESEPGGALRLIARAPGRAEIAGAIEWRLAELRRLGVPIELNVEVTPGMVAELRPDVVVVAAGSRARPSDIPGADLPHVVRPLDVLSGRAPGAGRAVVIDFEGYQAAINAAEALAAQARPVEIVTEDPFVSLQLGALNELTPWYSRAAASGIAFSPMTKVLEIEPEAVRVAHRFGPAGEERRIEGVGTVVLANYALAEDQLYDAIQALGARVYRIGDSVAPRRITHAVLEAQRVGREM
jgi:mycofactocin system FadH/OYE family oxidoreductase 2